MTLSTGCRCRKGRSDMERLTKEEVRLIEDELSLDTDHPTTRALAKLAWIYNYLTCEDSQHEVIVVRGSSHGEHQYFKLD